jgi:hypothetical protein
MSEQKLNWQQQLQTGEKVRLFGSPAFQVLFIILTLGAVIVTAAWAAIMRYTITGKPDYLLPREEALLRMIGGFGIIWLPLTLYCWGGMYFAGLQFAKSHLDYWDWRGKLRRLEYSRVLALCWHRSRPLGPISAQRLLRIHYLSPAGKRRQWLNLRNDLGDPAAIREELVLRCRLEPLGQALDKDGIWLQSQAPELTAGQYQIPRFPHLGMLLSQLALLVFGLALVAAFRFQWHALELSPPLIFTVVSWLLILGIVLAIIGWLKNIPKFGPCQALAVTWEEKFISVLTQSKPREKKVEIIPWPNISRLVLPPYPGQGVALLYLANEEPYRIYLAEAGDCLAFLGLMQSRGLVATA